MQRIDIQKEFAKVVASVGGTVLDKVLPAEWPFPNADYWFEKYNVVAELKCLREDLAKKADFNLMVLNLYNSWIRDGKVERVKRDKIRIDLRRIPESCALEFLELIKKRIENATIKKANVQIRQTIRNLGLRNAKGLLLLANDGNLVMKPDMLTRLVYRILKGKYSSIDSIVYFSLNYPARVPGIARPSIFWIDGVMNDREPPSKCLREKLRTTWLCHLSGIVPGIVFEVQMPNDPKILGDIDFVKR